MEITAFYFPPRFETPVDGKLKINVYSPDSKIHPPANLVYLVSVFIKGLNQEKVNQKIGELFLVG